MVRKNQGCFDPSRTRRPRRATSVKNLLTKVTVNDDILNNPQKNSLALTQVIQQPSDSVSQKQQNRRLHRQNRRRNQEAFIKEKELIYKNQSTLLFSQSQDPQYSIKNHFQTKAEELKYLFEQYTNETIPREWKPSTIEQSIEICQYAFEVYQEK